MEITITTHGKGKVHAVIDMQDPFGAFVEKWLPDMKTAIQWVSEKVLPDEEEEGK
jgi:hypothetical protein